MRRHLLLIFGAGLGLALGSAVAVRGQEQNAAPADPFAEAPAVDPWARLRGVAGQRGTPAEVAPPAPLTLSAEPEPPAEGRVPAGNARVQAEPTATAIDNATETGSTNPPRTPPTEVDRFAALGLRAGGLILYPAVETSAGYTTNATGTAGGPGSAYVRVSPELVLQSDWALHELRVALRGSYSSFFGGAADQPSASADAALRLDLPDRWQADLTGNYQLVRASLTDPTLPAGTTVAPAIHTGGVAAAISKPIGPLLLRGGVEGERIAYGPALVGGTAVDLSERNSSLVAGRLRVGSDAGRIVQPFVEGLVGRRFYDQPLDAGGLVRSGNVYALRGGLAYDSAPVLTAEVSAGYRIERPNSAALATLQGLTFDGTAVWSPRRLIAITFNAATTFNPNPSVASGGSILRLYAIDAAYDWRPNVTLHATAQVGVEHFQNVGIDTTTTVGGSATWRLNRSLWLTGRYAHQWVSSYDPARSSQSDTIEIGARLQR